MPPPPLHPGTLQPVGPDDLAPLFPLDLTKQQASAEREVAIPEPVRRARLLIRRGPRREDAQARVDLKYIGIDDDAVQAHSLLKRQGGVRGGVPLSPLKLIMPRPSRGMMDPSGGSRCAGQPRA